MPETTSRWLLDKKTQRLIQKTSWVVTEKIHGANFVFSTDGNTIRCGKRRSYLNENESFFGHESVLSEISPAILHAFQLLSQQYINLTVVYVYGELCGGSYPHPDVPAIDSLKAVQTGIYYCPNIRYVAFDIQVEYIQQDVPCNMFVDYSLAMDIFKDTGLLYAQPLLIGTFQQCIDYDVNFQSKLPGVLGYPDIPDYHNQAEGVVIKSLEEITVETAKGYARAIVKKKHPSFSEDDRYSLAEKWEDPKANTQWEDDTPALDLVKWELYPLITENRLANVVSKIGHVTKEDRER
eukprot:TRINITY_DN2191_c0_g1_i1.p1 TRINITY_DN2191_c0_g1~~TRINITY_DN2191_c0_g1_i1.p1  ORF type:complete len:304 (+),score=53.11 TRINITY_DN2191_c0_g1_i1:33-914(+)